MQGYAACLFVYYYEFTKYQLYSLCEMPGWMKHKLESRVPGEKSIISDMQMTPPSWMKVKN